MGRDLQHLDLLIVRLAEGDSAASTPAFEALWPEVRAHCFSLLKHPQDADDAAQQAMEKILTRASDYDRTRASLPWALAIAAWECRTITRRAQRRREVVSGELDGVTDGTGEEQLIRHELTKVAMDVLRGLPEVDRAILVQTFWQELRDTASPMQRKRRQRAISRLRAAFDRFTRRRSHP